MARETTKWPSKRGSITKIMPSDGCKGNRGTLAMGPWHDFHEIRCHLGNGSRAWKWKLIRRNAGLPPSFIRFSSRLHFLQVADGQIATLGARRFGRSDGRPNEDTTYMPRRGGRLASGSAGVRGNVKPPGIAMSACGVAGKTVSGWGWLAPWLPNAGAPPTWLRGAPPNAKAGTEPPASARRRGTVAEGVRAKNRELGRRSTAKVSPPAEKLIRRTTPSLGADDGGQVVYGSRSGHPIGGKGPAQGDRLRRFPGCLGPVGRLAE